MYGAANEKNLQGQPIPQIIYSHGIAAGQDNTFTGYLVDKGTFAKIPNIKKEFADNLRLPDGSEWYDSISNMPYVNQPVMIYKQIEKTDASNYNANTAQHIMSYMERYRIIVRYGIVTEYNQSASTPTGVLKVEGTKA